MKVEVELPDNIVDLLKAFGILCKEDPEAYLKSYLADVIVDVVQSHFQALSHNPFFDPKELAEKWELKGFVF